MINGHHATIDFDVYQPRNPKARLLRRVEEHFEQLEDLSSLSEFMQEIKI
jgi:hypothetical protein